MYRELCKKIFQLISEWLSMESEPGWSFHKQDILNGCHKWYVGRFGNILNNLVGGSLNSLDKKGVHNYRKFLPVQFKSEWNMEWCRNSNIKGFEKRWKEYNLLFVLHLKPDSCFLSLNMQKDVDNCRMQQCCKNNSINGSKHLQKRIVLDQKCFLFL